MSAWRLAAGAAALALAVPALAVGLGPLAKEGITDGPEKGFYLTVMNPYPDLREFRADAIGWDDEAAQSRVVVIPDRIELGGGRDRKLLVIARDLKPGETYRFRVCAEQAQPEQGVMIHARVCSKLSARRVAAAPAAGEPAQG